MQYFSYTGTGIAGQYLTKTITVEEPIVLPYIIFMSNNNKEFCTPITPYKYNREYKDGRGYIYTIPDNFVVGSAPTFCGYLTILDLRETTNTFRLYFNSSTSNKYMNDADSSYEFHIFSY